MAEKVRSSLIAGVMSRMCNIIRDVDDKQLEYEEKLISIRANAAGALELLRHVVEKRH